MKYPEDTLFEYCGLPSLLVSYKMTNNLFFSSLIGLNFIFAVEVDILRRSKVKKENKKYYKIFAFVLYLTIILQFIIDLSIRTHYIIDEIAGLLTAHFCMISSQDVTRYLDNLYPLHDNQAGEEVTEIASKEIPIIACNSNR